MSQAEKAFQLWVGGGGKANPATFFPGQGGGKPESFWLPHGFGHELGFVSIFGDKSRVIWKEWSSGGWRGVELGTTPHA